MHKQKPKPALERANDFGANKPGFVSDQWGSGAAVKNVSPPRCGFHLHFFLFE